MRKSLTTISVIAGILAFASPALAHTPSVVPSCSGLAVTLVSYEGSATNNRVTTTIDNVATVANFGGSYSQTFTWSQTVPHTWSVVIDANRSTGNATAFDTSFSGTWQACQPAPTTTTTTVAPTTTTLAPTTTTLAPTTTTGDPTTTTVEPTTTTEVASEAPVIPTTTTVALVASAGPVPPAGNVVLPATGYASGTIAILGLAAFGLGLTLLAVRRRSSSVSG